MKHCEHKREAGMAKPLKLHRRSGSLASGRRLIINRVARRQPRNDSREQRSEREAATGVVFYSSRLAAEAA